MRRPPYVLISPTFALALSPVACATEGDGRATSGAVTTITSTTLTTSGGGTDSDTSGGQSGSQSGGSSATTGGGSSATATTSGTTAGTATTSGTTGGVKFDLGGNPDGGAADDGTTGMACQKIDFLFVVDNSGSMEDEQTNLVNSFPGFIDTIQMQVAADDYHIMVVDTDADGGGGCFSSTTGQANCMAWCTNCLASGCECMCNNVTCTAGPVDDCDITLGAGKTKSMNDADCGIDSGFRYMLQTQANLKSTFQCLAQVGTNGSGSEKPMDAVREAVTTLLPAGECNEGFLRDDAILVVTVITDEEDDVADAGSMGDPNSWYNELVAVKNGDPNAIVALAIVGDTNQPNATCMGLNGVDGADDCARLRQWADLFPYGQWGSICAADFTPFFADAVSVIDQACDVFVPPG